MSEQLYIIPKDGRRRKATMVVCDYCGKEFLRVNHKIGKTEKCYCSYECCSLSNVKRIKLICHNCGKEFERLPGKIGKSKSGLSFCSNECKNQACSLDGGCSDIQPEHYGTSTVEYRNRMKKELEQGCANCGEQTRYLLDVHHIDKDRLNNEKENLIVLCKNCHKREHIKKATKKREILNRGCSCGNKDISILQVHHIDGNTKNNDESNLEVVCPNCYAKRHLKFVDGEWIYCTSSLTPRELVGFV